MQTIKAEEGYPLALFKTYLAFIYGSIGSRQYRQLYVEKPNGLEDVIGNGDLGCAIVVSSTLTLCGLTRGGVHTTVKETILDLEASGWERSEDLRQGAVIIWEPKLCDDNICHRHIGFFVGGNKAVSNNAREGTPIKHHITFGFTGPNKRPVRRIEAVYFHRILEAR